MLCSFFRINCFFKGYWRSELSIFPSLCGFSHLYRQSYCNVQLRNKCGFNFLLPKYILRFVSTKISNKDFYVVQISMFNN